MIETITFATLVRGAWLIGLLVALLTLAEICASPAEDPSPFRMPVPSPFRMPVPTAVTCGTNPSVIGNTSVGKITIGTGTVTSCTLALSFPYPTEVACMVSNTLGITMGVTSSAKTLVLSSKINMSGVVVSYLCIGII